MLSHINVGRGIGCTILELTETMKLAAGFQGEIIFAASNPDETKKPMEVSRNNRSARNFLNHLKRD